MTRTLTLLVVAAQLADVATFGLAVRAQGIGGESGIGIVAPMVPLYEWGGFGAVALAKVAAIVVVLAILAAYDRRTAALAQSVERRVEAAEVAGSRPAGGTTRTLALAVATVGVFGAATGLVAIL